MSKPLTLLIALVIVVGALFIIRSYNHREEGISSKEVVSPTAQASKSKDWREFSSVSGHFKVIVKYFVCL